MKTRFIVLTLILSISPLAVAVAEQGDDLGRQQRRIDHLSKELNLTEEQKPQLEAIFTQQREKRKALREETRTRLQQVLSPEQMTKLDEMRKKHHDRRKQRKASVQEENPELGEPEE